MYILKLEMQMHTKHGQMYLHAKAESRMTEWSIIVGVCVFTTAGLIWALWQSSKCKKIIWDVKLLPFHPLSVWFQKKNSKKLTYTHNLKQI